MAQQPSLPGLPAEGTDPLSTATFRSVLPTLDAILEVLYTQSEAESPPQGADASAQVAQKVSAIHLLPES
jgi:hypothetical protein